MVYLGAGENWKREAEREPGQSMFRRKQDLGRGAEREMRKREGFIEFSIILYIRKIDDGGKRTWTKNKKKAKRSRSISFWTKKTLRCWTF